ncbi:hypothetical protein ACOSP7_012917 [Xanthoceras sorbifolium]
MLHKPNPIPKFIAPYPHQTVRVPTGSDQIGNFWVGIFNLIREPDPIQSENSRMHGDITKTKRGRLGKGSSDVWTKFTKYGDRTRCKCNYCGKDYMFVKFLHVFYDITLKFSSSLSVTSNLFFHKLCSIETELTSFAKSNDSVLSEMSSSIKSKFDQYWGKIEDVNKLLIIALVLDPRYKLEYVKFCFDDMFDDKKTKELTCDIRELLIQLYECYNGVENILSSDQTSSSVSFDVEKTNENLNFRVERLKKFYLKLQGISLPFWCLPWLLSLHLAPEGVFLIHLGVP